MVPSSLPVASLLMLRLTQREFSCITTRLQLGTDYHILGISRSTAGNSVFLHLFLDALALQPCNPTLPTARDAWIQADANRYGGANRCTIWRAFASRGLGVGAANFVDSTSVPSGC